MQNHKGPMRSLRVQLLIYMILLISIPLLLLGHGFVSFRMFVQHLHSTRALRSCPFSWVALF